MVLLLLATAACGRLEVPPTELTDQQRAACAALVAALPRSVSDQPSRRLEDNPVAAAWGDPAIVLRCGVPTPAGYDKFASCQVVEDVDWFAPEELTDDQGKDAVLTTIGREPAVELTVPARYRPPAAALVDVAATVKAHTSVVRRCR